MYCKIEPFLISVENKISLLYSIEWLLDPSYIHKKLIGFVNSVAMIHHITEYYLAVCALVPGPVGYDTEQALLWSLDPPLSLFPNARFDSRHIHSP
jgi:hypothetical protein